MRLHYSIILASFFLVTTSCDRKAAEQSEAAVIRSARQFSNEAIARHDTAALASVWTTDYHVVTSRNFEVAGRVTNKDRFASEFSTKPDVIYVRNPDIIKVFDKWNMASESGTWVGRWTENGQAIELTGTYFAKWHRADGKWCIRAELFVPLTCSGGDFCNQSPIQ